MNKRNAGLEWLRLFALAGTLLTLLLDDTLLASLTGLRVHLYWLMKAAALMLSGCFPLLSGYMGYGRPCRWRRLARLLLQALVIGLGVKALWTVIDPGGSAACAWWEMLLPIHSRAWSYLCAYLVCFLVSPLLDEGIRQFTDGALRAASLLLIFACCFVSMLSGFDPFYLGLEPGALWLILCRIWGASARRLHWFEGWSVRRLLLCLAVIPVLGWLSRPVLSRISLAVTEYGFMTSWMVDFRSPLLLMGSLMLLTLFRRLPVTRAPGRLSPGVWSTYLLLAHPLVLSRLLPQLETRLAALPGWALCLLPLAAVLVSGAGSLLLRLPFCFMKEPD